MPDETNNLETSDLSLSLPRDLKARIELAAFLSGVNVTDFAIAALLNASDAALANRHTRTLSNRDRDIFLGMPEEPPEPNEALKKAAAKYKERINLSSE